MAACSFKAIVGGPCFYDGRDHTKSVNEVLLLSCVKDIERHKSLWTFTGVNGEQELILLSAGTYFHDTTGCQRSNHLSRSSVWAKHWMAKELQYL